MLRNSFFSSFIIIILWLLSFEVYFFWGCLWRLLLMSRFASLLKPFHSSLFFSRGHATLHLALSVGRSVGRSVRPSVTFLNSERFSHYCSCPTLRDWIAVYPALLNLNKSSCWQLIEYVQDIKSVLNVKKTINYFKLSFIRDQSGICRSKRLKRRTI